MGVLLFSVIAFALLFLWEIELLLRFALRYRATNLASDALVSRRAQLLVRLARIFTGFRVDFETGDTRDLPDPALFIANHQSLLDIVLFSAAFPHHRMRYVAKRELAWGIPAVSLLLRMQQHALIDRKGKMAEGKRLFARLGRHVQTRGVSPVVFPEGTRSRNGRVNTFHSGAVRSVLAGGTLPIVICALDGGTSLPRMRNILKLGQSRYRLAVLYYTPAPASKQEITAQLQDAREAIQEKMAEWTGTQTEIRI